MLHFISVATDFFGNPRAAALGFNARIHEPASPERVAVLATILIFVAAIAIFLHKRR